MPMYSISGLTVDMNCRGRLCLERGRRYEAPKTAVPDIVIKREDEEIKKRCKRYPSMNEDEWEYVFMGSKFYNALTEFDGMLLHSSAVVVDGRAYLFSAPCGTGKSTHTQLWLKLFGDRAYVINDDKPAIRMEDGEFYVYGTPFSGKHDISRNTRVKLGGICFISRGTENEISVMKGEDVIVNFLEQTIRTLSMESMDRMLSTLDKLLSRYRIYSLKCNMELDAARLSYETMSGERSDDR